MRAEKKQSPRRPDVRKLKIQPRARVSRTSVRSVPEIKLCGDWLQHLGFQMGDHVTITSMPRLLIIRCGD